MLCTSLQTGRSASRAGERTYISLLYGLNIATSYLLMLAVMTYNVGYFFIIVAGLALGHFIFLPAASAANPAAMVTLSEACCPQPS